MKRFKFFVSDLKEALTPEQAAGVSTWKRNSKAVATTDQFFGKGIDDKIEDLPVDNSHKSEVHRAVEKHIGKDIDHDEYKSGVVPDPKYPNRKIKLGKLIKDQKILNQFANDSTRQAKKLSGLKVRITRSPAGVAGQTSGNQSWVDQSCKNFETGVNKRYLKHEVEHGTVVGYLMDGDKEIARSTLQPFLSNDKTKRTYGVVGQYGVNHAGFHKHMENVARRLSGEPDNQIYKIHPRVYDDRHSAWGMLHTNATSEHISKALDDPNGEVRATAIQHPNATSEHIGKAMNDESSYVRQITIKHPNATSEHISKALNDEDRFVRFEASIRPDLTSEHIGKAINDSDLFVRRAAIKHPNATSEHISKALNDSDEGVRQMAIRNPNATAEHISKALNDEEWSVRQEAILNPNATAEHINKALDDPNGKVRATAIQHPNATPEIIHKAETQRKPAIESQKKIVTIKPKKYAVKKSFKSHIDTMPSLEH